MSNGLRRRRRDGVRPRAVAAAAVVAGLAMAGSVCGATVASAATAPVAQANRGSAPASAVVGPHVPEQSTANLSSQAVRTSALPTARATEEQNASSQAETTGKPVPVDGLTTETLQVTANPDGTFAMTSNARPVRVREHGTWVPINPALTRQADGTYAPAASALPMAFSGGGTGPLVTVSDPSSPAGSPRTLSLYWPQPLPAPEVSGAAAVYPEVFPGVDLRLAASGDSYTEVLVVHDAKAAADPGLAALRLTARGTGLSLKQDANGRLEAVDAHGSTVLTGALPSMWDSTANTPKGPAPSADNPGSGVLTALGTKVAARAAASGTADVTLVPPARALTGSGVHYPLYIDPGLTWQQNLWITVDSLGGQWVNTSHSNYVEVGDCTASDCDPVAVFRSYFQLNTTPLDGSYSNGTHATVSSATFNITQIWNAADGCTAEPVDLYGSGPISSSTTWPGPAMSYISQASSGAGNGCAAANVSLDAKSFVQTAADQWDSNTTFLLRAASESNGLQWKQFDDNPALSVVFYYPPNPAVNLDVAGVSCNSTWYVPTLTPKLTATATDNNSPALNVNLHFSINGSSGTASNTPSGNVGSWQVPSGVLTADTSYKYTVSVDNGHLSAASTSTSGAFTPLTQPATTPTVTSFDYPPDYWGQPSGTGGHFFVSSPDPNLQGFIYTLTGSGTERAADSTACATQRVQNFSNGQLTDGFVPLRDGKAAIDIPPGLSVGYHTLNVESVDYANIPSHESATYQFYVAPDLTHPSGDLALNKTVTVSSTSNSKWPATSLTDGSYVSSGTDYGWSSAGHTSAAGTEWASVDLGSAQSIDDVDLYPRDDTAAATGDGFPTAFTIATSTDGSTWTTQASLPGDYPTPGDSPERFAFPPTSARYVKVTATGLTTDPYGTYYFQLKQIAVSNGVTSSRYPSVDGKLVAGSVTGANGDSPYILTQVGVYSGLSDGAQTYFVGGQVGDVYTETITVPTTGYYALGADMTRAGNYGQVSYTIDGKALKANGASSFDGYRSSCCDTAYAVLGGAYLTAGTHALSMTVAGENSSATGYNAGVDYLTVAPVSYATYSNFSAAENNNGIATDNQAASGSLDMTSGYSSLSGAALTAAGLTTGSTVPINGFGFRLTAPNSGGYDNVVALGQTIGSPVPAVPTSSIALLTAATCGTVSGGYVTITYTDGTDRQDALGTVPDWALTPPSGSVPAVTMTYYDKGTGAVPTTRNTYLYTVALPTDSTKTIASVTLPSYTTTMVQGGCSDALHVLAIGTRPGATTTVGGTSANWLGAWAAPADTATGSSSSPAFSAKTLREIVHPTDLGAGTGAQIRIRLTDPQDATAVTLSRVTLAAQAAGTGPGTLNGTTPVALTFDGSGSVTLLPGTELYSDPVTVPSTSGGSGDLIVSLSIPGTATTAPVHTDATTAGAGPATYVASGDATADSAGSATTWSSSGTDTRWFYVEDADVTTTDTTQGTVVVLGDQTALGAGADGHTWADDLPAALASGTGVVNRTPGGTVNLSTAGATITSTLANLQNTVQDEPDVRTVIISLGTNDLLAGTDYLTLENHLQQLISALQNLGVRVYVTSVAPDTATAFTTTQELNREQLDNDITNPSNWGYSGYADFDTTTTGCGRQNSGDPASTMASLLTNGAPNSTYYQDLANTAVVPVTPGGVGTL